MRKLTAFVMLLMLSVVLVACTGEDEEPEPTVAPTAPQSTRVSEPTSEATADPGSDAGTPATADASPETVIASPAVVDDATPVMMTTPDRGTPITAASPVASPVVIEGTPVASPVLTPGMSGTVLPPATPTGVNTPAVRIEMTGTVVLNGAENEAYVLTEKGCVGLGRYSGLHADRQVVVRNEQGTIVSVTTLERADNADGCAWEFVVAVPQSAFYSVSVPMVFEQVFPGAQVTAEDGVVRIELP